MHIYSSGIYVDFVVHRGIFLLAACKSHRAAGLGGVGERAGESDTRKPDLVTNIARQTDPTSRWMSPPRYIKPVALLRYAGSCECSLSLPCLELDMQPQQLVANYSWQRTENRSGK